MIVTNASDDFRLITCAMLMSLSHTEEQAKLCLQSVSIEVIWSEINNLSLSLSLSLYLSLSVFQLNTSLITERSHELQHLALKFGHISSLLEYMSSTLKSMHEAWEDLLLMMDSKLASYASVRCKFILL